MSFDVSTQKAKKSFPRASPTKNGAADTTNEVEVETDLTSMTAAPAAENEMVAMVTGRRRGAGTAFKSFPGRDGSAENGDDAAAAVVPAKLRRLAANRTDEAASPSSADEAEKETADASRNVDEPEVITISSGSEYDSEGDDSELDDVSVEGESGEEFWDEEDSDVEEEESDPDISIVKIVTNSNASRFAGGHLAPYPEDPNDSSVVLLEDDVEADAPSAPPAVDEVVALSPLDEASNKAVEDAQSINVASAHIVDESRAEAEAAPADSTEENGADAHELLSVSEVSIPNTAQSQEEADLNGTAVAELHADNGLPADDAADVIPASSEQSTTADDRPKDDAHADVEQNICVNIEEQPVANDDHPTDVEVKSGNSCEAKSAFASTENCGSGEDLQQSVAEKSKAKDSSSQDEVALASAEVDETAAQNGTAKDDENQADSVEDIGEI